MKKRAGYLLLLMHGDKDRICNIEGSRIIAERMEKSGENIEYVEWKELFHEIHNGGEKSNGDEVIEKSCQMDRNALKMI